MKIFFHMLRVKSRTPVTTAYILTEIVYGLSQFHQANGVWYLDADPGLSVPHPSHVLRQVINTVTFGTNGSGFDSEFRALLSWKVLELRSRPRLSTLEKHFSKERVLISSVE